MEHRRRGIHGRLRVLANVLSGLPADDWCYSRQLPKWKRAGRQVTESERRTLAAAFSRILPDGTDGAGATEADVIAFVDGAITAGTCAFDIANVLRLLRCSTS